MSEFGFDDDSWMARLRSAQDARDSVSGSIEGYELLEPAGRGGQGTVFKARQPGTGRVVALKRVADLGGDDRGRERFRREVELAASLHHPNIVTIHELAEDGRSLVMEWVEGSTSDAWSDARRNAGDAEAVRAIVRAARGACEGVAFAHGRGVIHRDLKPSNILIDEQGRAKVVDFGLARDVTAKDQTLTHEGAFAGTPLYAPPEQIDQGLRDADVRADVYAMGAVLYRLLAGSDAFAGATLASLFDRIRRGRPAPPSSVAPAVDAELDAIVLMAMRPEREARYQTMDELARDLSAWLDRRPVKAHPPTTLYLARAFVRRHRLGVGLAGVGVALVLGFAVAAGVTAWRLAMEKKELKKTIGERDTALDDARDKAEALQLEVIKASTITNALMGMVENVAEAAPEHRVALEDALDRYVERLDKSRVPLRPDVALGMRLQTSTLYDTLHSPVKARREAERAVEIGRTRALTTPAFSNALAQSGRHAMEAKEFELAVARIRESKSVGQAALGQDSGDVGESSFWLVDCLMAMGRPDEAQRAVDDFRQPAEMTAFIAESMSARVREVCARHALRPPAWVRAEPTASPPSTPGQP